MDKEKVVVFYSWQSDVGKKANHYFILEALENAVKKLGMDDELKVEPVVDRDTQGVAGSPDIAKTIFDKIEKAHIFVCDVSIINKAMALEHKEIHPESSPRLTPNPNVLFELGYAFQKMGDKRVIMVMNLVYGDPEDRPFDLRPRRTVRYSLTEEGYKDTKLRASIQKQLEQTLVEALDRSLEEVEVPSTSKIDQVKIAIEEDKPNQAALVRRFMENEVIQAISENISIFDNNTEDQWDEQLVKSIDNLTNTVGKFCELSTCIAEMNAEQCAHMLYNKFSDILNLYTYSQSQRTPHIRTIDQDLQKFIGHELFVIFFTCLIRENRWEIITDLLKKELYAREDSFTRPKDLPFYHLSSWVPLLDERRNQRLKLNQLSVRSNLLNERHTEGALTKYVTMEEFIEADFFLYLRAQIQGNEEPKRIALWWPWSWVHMEHPPRFLLRAKNASFANQLVHALGVSDLEVLRQRLQERTIPFTKHIAYRTFLYPMSDFDYNAIGVQ